VKGRLAACAAALAGSAVLGVAAGLIWATVAPRALLQEVGHGEAQLVNPESTAYILADAWFCLIAAIGGVVTGIAGYRLLVRRAGWTAAAGLVLGSVAARTLGWGPTTTCSPSARTASSSTPRWPWVPRARWRSGRASPP
jgi:hypothetical protein